MWPKSDNTYVYVHVIGGERVNGKPKRPIKQSFKYIHEDSGDEGNQAVLSKGLSCGCCQSLHKSQIDLEQHC